MSDFFVSAQNWAHCSLLVAQMDDLFRKNLFRTQPRGTYTEEVNGEGYLDSDQVHVGVQKKVFFRPIAVSNNVSD